MTIWLTPRHGNCLLYTFVLTCLFMLGLYLIIHISSFSSCETSPSFRLPQVSQMHMFATKTKYWDQNSDYTITAASGTFFPAITDSTNETSFQQHLVLIQSQIVARHGIRFPTASTIREIEHLLQKIQPFATLLPTWLQNYSPPYNLSVEGALADAGKQELRDYSARILARNGYKRPQVYSKETYRLVHTYVPRSRQSAIACASSFFSNAQDVEYIEKPKHKDILLRFFEQCGRYQREVKTNPKSQAQFHAFQKSPIMSTSAQTFKQLLGLQHETIVLSIKDVMAAQSACAFDIALKNHVHHWCTLMPPFLLRSVEYLDDMEQFYWIGGGYKLNYEMAAVLLREIFESMKAKATRTSTLAGIFFFAHAETTVPLMTLLGYTDRTRLVANVTDAEMASRHFRTSNLCPFAANLEFRLFHHKSNQDDVYAQILVNEKNSIIPGCGRVFCKLAELEHLWHYYLKTYDFNADCK